MIGFLCISLILAALLYIKYEIETSNETQHNIDTLNIDIQRLYQSLINQETGQRGFSLTGNQAFLDPFYRGTDTFNQKSTSIQKEIKYFPSLKNAADSLITKGRYWHYKYGVFQVNLKKNGLDIPDKVLEDGKDIFDDFRRIYRNINKKIEILKNSQEKASQNRILLVLTFVFFIIVSILIFAIFYIIKHITKVVQPIVQLERSVYAYSHKDFTITVPNYDKDDELGRLISGIDRMRDQLKDKFNNLESIAYKDGLTGINNRRTLDYYINKYLEMNPQPNELSIILLDIDHFKKFNDAYGHLEGDRVLKHIACLIQTQIKTFDISARFGGEEFMIILPNTPYLNAKMVAERLRITIERESLDSSYPISASFGVTTMENGDTYISLVQKADTALYRAKEQGRNRVEIVLNNPGTLDKE